MTNDTATTIGSAESLMGLWLESRGDNIAKMIAGAYKWITDRHLGTAGRSSSAFGQNGETLPRESAKEIGELEAAFSGFQIREKNLRAIRFLDEWFAEPDDLGADVWEKFDKELEANRFTI